MLNNFPVAGVKYLMVTHVSNTPNTALHEYCSAKHEWELKNVIIRNY